MKAERTDSWFDWRQGVVVVLRADFSDILVEVGENDIDWDAWRPLYEEGRSPTAAVARAFVRDL
jgi:hypothetical protein